MREVRGKGGVGVGKGGGEGHNVARPVRRRRALAGQGGRVEPTGRWARRQRRLAVLEGGGG